MKMRSLFKAIDAVEEMGSVKAAKRGKLSQKCKKIKSI